jgi:hypothetical protein
MNTADSISGTAIFGPQTAEPEVLWFPVKLFSFNLLKGVT